MKSKPMIQNTDKILIMKPSSLGDIVHTIPVVQAIRHCYPGAYISWFVQKDFEPLVRQMESVDSTIPFHRHGFSTNPLLFLGKQVGTVKSLRSCRFDWVLDFQGLFRSGLFTFLSGAPKRFGFSWNNEPNSFFYNIHGRIPKKDHAVNRNIKLLDQLGVPVCSRDLEASFKARDLSADISISGNSPALGVCPGGRWESKRWPVQNYALLVKHITGRLGGKVVLLGSRVEEKIGSFIAKECRRGIINLMGKTSLADLPHILKQLDLVVANDTGSMHLATAVGTKVLALFGPTDPVRTGPYGEKHKVLTAGIACQPCFKKICPTNGECLKGISVDEVFYEVTKMLNETTDCKNR